MGNFGTLGAGELRALPDDGGFAHVKPERRLEICVSGGVRSGGNTKVPVILPT